MSKSKIPADRIGNAKAKTASQVGDVSDLRARRAARSEYNKKLVRKDDDQLVDVTAQVAESISNHSEAEKLVQATDEDRSVVATIEQPKAQEPAAQELPAPVAISLPTRLLRAALSVAGKDDTRYYINGVRVHQTPDGQTRIAATDGTRLLVTSLTDVPSAEWAAQGVTLPTEQLQRMLRYFGKDLGEVELSFGIGHQYVIVTAPGDGASFKVAPIDGGFPDYQRVMDSGAEAFTAERDGVAAPMLDPSYLKSASQVAAAFESEGIMAHTGSTDGKTPVVFTFQGVDNAVLYIMPKVTASDYSLPDATVKMYGRGAMKKTVEDLRAYAAKCLANAKKAKHEKFRALFKAKAARLTAQADSIEAANSVKIAGPKASEAETVAAAVATARAVTTASVH